MNQNVFSRSFLSSVTTCRDRRDTDDTTLASTNVFVAVVVFIVIVVVVIVDLFVQLSRLVQRGSKKNLTKILVEAKTSSLW